MRGGGGISKRGRLSKLVVIAVVSDLHVGSSVALCPPKGIALEDGGRYIPNAAQLWIWDRWVEFWQEVKRRKKRGAQVIVVVNGEFVDGDHHETTQLASASPEIQAAAAIEVMGPPMVLADELYVTRGTEAHSGKGAASDMSIARELGAVIDPSTGTRAAYQWILNAGGVVFDFAHHISGAMRLWSKGNNIRTEVLDMMTDGRDPPDVVVRSHVHTFAETGRNFRTYGVVTPAWQLKTEYANRITRRQSAEVGGLIFEVVDKQWEIIPMRYPVPQSKPHPALARLTQKS